MSYDDHNRVSFADVLKNVLVKNKKVCQIMLPTNFSKILMFSGHFLKYL